MSEPALALARAARGEGSLAAALGLGAEGLGRVISLGLAHLRVGAADKSVRVMRGLVALEPRLALSHFYLGLALLEAKCWAPAERSLTTAIELSDTDDSLQRRACVLRARCRLLLGDREGARQDLDEARGDSSQALEAELRLLECAWDSMG